MIYQRGYLSSWPYNFLVRSSYRIVRRSYLQERDVKLKTNLLDNKMPSFLRHDLGSGTWESDAMPPIQLDTLEIAVSVAHQLNQIDFRSLRSLKVTLDQCPQVSKSVLCWKFSDDFPIESL